MYMHIHTSHYVQNYVQNEPTPISLTANIVDEQKSGQFLGGTVISRRGLVVVSMHFGCVHVAG